MTEDRMQSMWLYHNFLREHGFSRIGQGFMHQVYSKGEYVYKFVRSDRTMLNNLEHFKKEKSTLEFLICLGIPTVKPIEIIEPGVLIPEYYALKEELCTGFNFTWENIPNIALTNLFQFVQDTSKITGNVFGRVLHGSCQYITWNDYLLHKLEGYENLSKEYQFQLTKSEISELCVNWVNYHEAPRLLLMDFVPSNFFFDNNFAITQLIDIDHPIFGDPFYQFAELSWKYRGKYNKYLCGDFGDRKINILYLYYLILMLSQIKLRKCLSLSADDIVRQYKNLEYVLLREKNVLHTINSLF